MTPLGRRVLRTVRIWLGAVLTLVASSVLAAAGSPPAEATPAPAVTKVTVGAFASPDTPWDDHWQIFKKAAEQRSAGQIQVKLLTRSEAGGEATTMTYIRRGRMQFGGFTLQGTASVLPELAVLSTPFFFDNQEEVDFVMDRYLLPKFRTLFARKNLELLYWVDVGWMEMYGKKPLLRPSDAVGYRLRAQASVTAQIFVRSIGGDMLQMNFADLIPGLQTGLVDGGETNLILYAMTGLAKEAAHVTLTHHSYDSGVIVANKQWFDALPAAQRQILTQAFPGTTTARRDIRTMTARLLETLKQQPVVLHTLSPRDQAAWKAATKDNYQAIIDRVGGEAAEVYAIMLEGRTAYRQQQRRE